MNKHIPKRPSLTKKIRRLFAPERGKYMHGLYPEEYFKQYWLSRGDSNGVKAISRLAGMNQKATLHYFCEEGILHFMRELVKKDLDAMATPEGRAAQASRTRYYLELRRLCRERGWDIKKLF
jgi:hypothetical protein